MADTPISGLPAATSAVGTQEIPVNESGTTKRVTVAQVKAYVGGLLGSTSYSTGSDSAWATIVSSTSVAIDATNAAVTVTVPASGKILVSIDLDVSFSYSAFPYGPSYLTLMSGAAEIAAMPINFFPNQATNARYATVGGRYHATFLVTGLSAGSTTIKAGMRTSAYTCYAYANDATGASGHYAGPFVMAIWDAT